MTNQLRSAIVIVLAYLAGIGSFLATAAPTGISLWDSTLRFLLGAVITLAASQAQRQTVLVFGMILTALSGLSLATIAGGASMVVALAAIFFLPRRDEAVNALAGALAAQAVLRLPRLGPFGTQSVVVALALALLLVSAYRFSTSKRRKIGRRVAIFVAVIVGVVALVFGLSLIQLRADAERGVSAAQRGLDGIREGDPAKTASELELAELSMLAADKKLNRWWMAPAQLLPVVSQHHRALTVATGVGSHVVRDTRLALEQADLETVQLRAGEIDLGTLQDMAPQLRSAAISIGSGRAQIAESDSPWLVSPLRKRLDSLSAELLDAEPQALLAAEAAELVPGLLGADREQRYLVLFGNPAEARELGGFVSGYAVLGIDNGQISKVESGRWLALSEYAERGALDADAYPDRYLETQPDVFAANLTSSPDPLLVARAVRDLFPELAGAPIDGMIYVDPFAIAAFLQLTGPVELEGVSGPITSDNAASFLLRDQYDLFTDSVERQEDFDGLFNLLDATLNDLSDLDLPGPERLGALLGPAARQGRLQIVTFDERSNVFLRRVQLLSDFPSPGRHDFVSVVHANGAANKLDALLHRSVSYQVQVDKESGALAADLSISLTSTVPDETPAYMLGLPSDETVPGQNAIRVSVYSPHQLSAISVDGQEIPFAGFPEAGYARYVFSVTVDPNTTETVTLSLTGEVDPSVPYKLLIANQPLANDDQMMVEYRDQDGRLVSERAFVLTEDTIFE